MLKISCLIAIFAACGLVLGADWPTDGGSPKRDGWQRNESILNKANVSGLKLLWKVKLDNEPREMHSLLPVVIADQVRTTGGTKQIAVQAGSSDNLYAIDVDAGTVLWKKHFPYVSEKPQLAGRGPLCPGGVTATPVIGRASESGPRTVYAVSSDGMLHSLNIADGEDVTPPVNFLPPNAKAYALNLWNDVIYSTSAQGCGGNRNAVWAIDLSSSDKKVTKFIPGGNGGLWGREGASIGSDGTIYAPTGDGPFDPDKHQFSEAIIALTPKDLNLKDYYSPTNAAFMWKRDLDMQVTPAVFDYKGRELLATSSKECRIFLLDSKSLGGADHRTPLYRSSLMCNEEVNFAAAGVWGNLATWEDPKGTRWLLSPFWGPVHPDFKAPVSYGPVEHGAITAFKVEEQNSKTVLTPVWMSRDMDQAEPPVIANEIVFAYGSGENNVQATPEEGLAANTSAKRISKSSHAILFALDAETGKELWSSGNTITSFAHFGELSVANGRVYLAAYDGTLYAFGLPGR